MIDFSNQSRRVLGFFSWTGPENILEYLKSQPYQPVIMRTFVAASYFSSITPLWFTMLYTHKFFITETTVLGRGR